MASGFDNSKTPPSGERRRLLKAGGAITASPLLGLVPDAVRNSAWAAGSDAPEKKDMAILMNLNHNHKQLREAA